MPSNPPDPAAWPFVHAVLSLFSEHDMTAWLSWRCDGEYAPVSYKLAVDLLAILNREETT